MIPDLWEHPTRSNEYAIGIMSGTSVDGIDAALLSISTDQSNHSFNLVATNSIHLPEPTRNIIHTLNYSGDNEIAQSGALAAELSHYYFQAIEPLIHYAEDIEISVIGCHGQTIRHYPQGITGQTSHGFTVQLVNGAILSQLSNIPVVTDFRSADIAQGGQGAPLAPAFHRAAFSSPDETRAVINIGGISNITLLPKNRNQSVVGYDVGPGNTLMDQWIRTHRGLAFDKDGAWAKTGQPNEELLKRMLLDEYFRRPIPKSTGVDYFNLQWLAQYLGHDATSQPSDEHIQATLTALTAQTIADQINGAQTPIDRAFICGGGAYNDLLMQWLQDRTSTTIESTEKLGIAPQWVESAAFAWMAHRTLHKLPSTLPSVTGALKPTIAGAIYYP